MFKFESRSGSDTLPSLHRSDTQTADLQWAHGKSGYLFGSFYCYWNLYFAVFKVTIIGEEEHARISRPSSIRMGFFWVWQDAAACTSQTSDIMIHLPRF